MFRKRLAALLSAATIAATLAAAPAHAVFEGNELSRKLAREGNVLVQQGRIKEAIAKLNEATRADPTASMPLSSIAHLLATLAGGADPKGREALRQQATMAAHAALQRFPNDPLAQEVLRSLEDDTDVPLNAPNAAAAKAHAEAELAFSRQDWSTALKYYREAMAADPRFSRAWVGAGDCHFVTKQWPEAEQLFREATVIEPRNSQAWRFLADALVHQQKFDEAVDALESGIAAHPSQRPNWEKLNALLSGQGKPALARLDMRPKARPGKKDGEVEAIIAGDTLQAQEAVDVGIWLVQVSTAMGLRKAQPGLGAYQVELQAWRKAFETADQVAAKDGREITDPSLLTVQKLYRANQLDAAILLLRYREAYRPDLEAWLASHPHGVREFVATWSLRP